MRSNPFAISDEYDNDNFQNNVDSIFCDDEELKNLYGNKPQYVKFYRRIKNLKSNKFPFKPQILRYSSESRSRKASDEKYKNKSFEYHFVSASMLDKEKEKEAEKEVNIHKINDENNPYKSFKSPAKENFQAEEEKSHMTRNEQLTNSIKKKLMENLGSHNKLKSHEAHSSKIAGAKRDNDNQEKNKNGEFLISESLNNNFYDKKKLDFFLYGKKLNEKSLKISDKIYNKGINMLKRKERLIFEKTLAEDQELNKLTFMPNLDKKILKLENHYKLSINNKHLSHNSLINSRNTSELGKQKKINNSYYSSINPEYDSHNGQFKGLVHKSQENKTKKIENGNHNYKSFASNKKLKSEKKECNKSNCENTNGNYYSHSINNEAKGDYNPLINNFNPNMLKSAASKGKSTNVKSNLSNSSHLIYNYNNDNYSTNISHNTRNNNNNNINSSNSLSKSKNNEKKLLGSLIQSKKKVFYNNYSLYDRCNKWMENKEIKHSKMRQISETEEKKNCYFSPVLNKSKLKYNIDDRFIKSEIKYIDSYIRRRKNSIENEAQKKQFEEKIFCQNLETFRNKKITCPEEFSFNSTTSRKSQKNNNKANCLHKAGTVKQFRKEFNTSNFFNLSVVEFEETILNNHCQENQAVEDHAHNNYNNDNINNSKNFLMKSLTAFKKIQNDPLLVRNRRLINKNLNKNKDRNFNHIGGNESNNNKIFNRKIPVTSREIENENDKNNCNIHDNFKPMENALSDRNADPENGFKLDLTNFENNKKNDINYISNAITNKNTLSEMENQKKKMNINLNLNIMMK